MESAALAESAGPGALVDRGELAGLAVSVGQEESAGLGELADHLLGHTIRLRRGRTRAQSRLSRRQALFPTIQDSATRTEIWRKTSPHEMGMRRRSQPIGWPTDPQRRIAPTISSEDLATLPIPGADAMEHSVAINPAEELKPRATAEGPASGVLEVEARAAAVAVAVVAAAEDVVEAVEDDVSWRFGRRGSFDRKLLKRTANKIETSDEILQEFYNAGSMQILGRHPGICVLPFARLSCDRCDVIRTAGIPITCSSSKGFGRGCTYRRYGRSFLNSRRRCEGGSLVGRSGCR